MTRPRDEDLTGQQFGRLTVMGFSGWRDGSGKGQRYRLWRCICSCGKEAVVSTGSLRCDNTRSCGCLRQHFQAHDLTGQVFGKLTVLHECGRKFGNVVWLCQCECGETKAYRSSKLIGGVAKSCGCGAKKRRKTGAPHKAEYAINEYVSGATARGLAWGLTFEEAISLLEGDCFYCGAAPSREARTYRKSQGVFLCNGIDRLDSTRGYIRGNCVSCCTACNYLKGTRTVDEFLSQVERIATHRQLVRGAS